MFLKLKGYELPNPHGNFFFLLNFPLLQCHVSKIKESCGALLVRSWKKILEVSFLIDVYRARDWTKCMLVRYSTTELHCHSGKHLRTL